MPRKIQQKPIPIIDLFAGPGGLGEGFCSLLNKNKTRRFKIALSIEMDEFAHKTLTLRSFVRQFAPGKIPDAYYRFVRGEIDMKELYSEFPAESEKAKEESWRTRLGTKYTSHEEVDKKITVALNGQHDFVLIGGPPCQAYSLVGRARTSKINGQSLNKEDERIYLYREYYRILAVHNPAVFIMENVKGILSSRLNNTLIFKELAEDLENPVDSYKKLEGKEDLPYICPGYKLYSLVRPVNAKRLFEDGDTIPEPTDFIIRTEDYGIPQTRHRVIILGVRRNLNVIPDFLKKASELIPIKKLLEGVPPLRSGLSKEKDSKKAWKSAVQAFFETTPYNEIENDVAGEIERTIGKLRNPQKDRGGLFVSYKTVSAEYEGKWFLDKKIGGICNHETRGHIQSDLHRYLFASCFAKVKNRSPKLSDFPPSLLPNHENVGDGVSENKFADRFRVQLADQPSKTVTSHISKDGHYFIHPDPTQCRSMTVREAARIQTFPDNYYFCGPRTEQYKQVGNAVPPLLAYQVANIVYEIMQGTPNNIINMHLRKSLQIEA